MKYFKFALVLICLTVSNQMIAQHGKVYSSFQAFGFSDSTSLKYPKTARRILADPHLFKTEKEMFLSEINKMDADVVAQIDVVILRLYLTPFLGVFWDNTPNGTTGKINKIHKNTTAEKSKLKIGDIVTSINGCSFQSLEEINYCLDEAPLGEPVKFQFERKGKLQTTTIKLANRLDTHQSWKDDYFIDMVMGQIALEDFIPTSGKQTEADYQPLFVTPEGKNYLDLGIPIPTIMLDTALARELFEDIHLTDYDRKILFKEMGDSLSLIGHMPKHITAHSHAEIRRLAIRSLALMFKFSPESGISVTHNINAPFAKINAIKAGSAAADLGLKIGDFIKSVGGQVVLHNVQLSDVCGAHEVGDSIEVTIIRKDKEMSFMLVLKNRYTNYEKWTSELNNATTDGNYDLKDYLYLEDKFFFRDTVLFDCAIQLMTIKIELNLHMGYIPVLTYSINLLFPDAEQENKFHRNAKDQTFQLYFLTKKKKLAYGGPDGVQYISSEEISFSPGSGTFKTSTRYPMGKFIRSADDQEFVSQYQASYYMQVGMEVFDIHMSENTNAPDFKKMQESYRYHGGDNFHTPMKDMMQSKEARTKKKKE